jgi:putative transposase
MVGDVAMHADHLAMADRIGTVPWTWRSRQLPLVSASNGTRESSFEEYNHKRPHQALGMRYPCELYAPSARRYQGLPPLEYPLHDQTITVTQCGRLCFGDRKINLSVVFAGQNVGVREVADHVWLVTFMHYDLGFFDDQECRVECAPNPFGAKVLPMSPE